MNSPHGVSPPIATSASQHYAYPDGALIQLDCIPRAHAAGASGQDTDTSDRNGDRDKSKSVPLTVRVVRTLATTFSCVLLVERVSTHHPPPPPPGPQSRYPPSKSGLRRPPGHNAKPPSAPSRPHSPKQYVLKLLDRRFATHLRADYAAAPWTPDTERLLAEFNALPEDSRPIVSLPCAEGEDGEDSWTWTGSPEDQTDSHNESSGDSSGEEDDEGNDRDDGEEPEKTMKKHVVDQHKRKRVPNAEWSEGHREAYLEKWAQRLYKQELTVYNALRALQGARVPGLYGTVRVRSVSSNDQNTIDENSTTPSVQVQGMLLQYLHPAFPLSELPARIPYFTAGQGPPAPVVPRKKGRKSTEEMAKNTNADTWASIARAAVRLVQDIGDAGVLNADLRLDNILVVPNANDDDRGLGAAAVDSALDGEAWEVVTLPPHLLRKHPGPATVQSTLDGEPWEVVILSSSNTKKHTSQTVVAPLPSFQTYSVYMLDFGLARLQRRDEPDGAFLRARRERDEEGAVGYVLQALLMKATRGLECDLPWRFVHSRRLEKEGDGSDDEAGI